MTILKNMFPDMITVFLRQGYGPDPARLGGVRAELTEEAAYDDMGEDGLGSRTLEFGFR